jgi:hypothetical protein
MREFLPEANAIPERVVHFHDITLRVLFDPWSTKSIRLIDEFAMECTKAAVCTENLSSGVVVMKAAKDGA